MTSHGGPKPLGSSQLTRQLKNVEYKEANTLRRRLQLHLQVRHSQPNCKMQSKLLLSAVFALSLAVVSQAADTIVAFSGNFCDGDEGLTVPCDGSCHQFDGRHSVFVRPIMMIGRCRPPVVITYNYFFPGSWHCTCCCYVFCGPRVSV